MRLTELFKRWTYQVFAPGALLRERYNAFKELLGHDDRALELLADIEDIAAGAARADWARVRWLCERLGASVREMVECLSRLSSRRSLGLEEYFRKIEFYVRMAVSDTAPDCGPPYVVPLARALDRPDLAGGKAANLAAAAQRALVPTPPGLVVTTKAFQFFLESNELRAALDKRLRRIDLSRPDELAALSEEMMDRVLHATVPEEVEEAIRNGLADQAFQGRLLAARSSAVAEDGPYSFAGLYRSVLNVPASDIVNAYKRVLAGKYRPRALTGRILSGLADDQTPMAVLIMPMVEASAAGVLYTLDHTPDPDRREAVGVYAAPGLGSVLVDGCVSPETTWISRDAAAAVLDRREARSGTCPGFAPEARITPAGAPVLALAAARELARWGLALEAALGGPQDVEWAIEGAGDQGGRTFILQSRPLQAQAGEGEEHAAPTFPPPGATTLYSGGERASSGRASGPVLHLSTVIDAAAVPVGSVVVTPTMPPSLIRLVGRVAAVVAGAGARACHFASAARTFGLPALVAHPDIALLLPQGQVVTVDADLGIVVAGAFAEAPAANRASALTERLHPVMPHISRLTLTDPDSPSFSPEGVRSLHDIIRFAHETAVREMFSLVGQGGRGLSRAKKFKSDLPIELYVLDLDNGLFEAVKHKDLVTPDDIRSLPLWALWWGLSSPEERWDSSTRHLDMEGLARMGEGGIVPLSSRYLASFAVISENYLHLSLRFGYHFSLVDAVCGAEANRNYINFRFKGGGAGMGSRMLRLCFLRRTLEHFGFQVTTRGDMLDASVARESENATQKGLAVLGRLLARTRLLDMELSEEAEVETLTKDYIARLEDAYHGGED